MYQSDKKRQPQKNKINFLRLFFFRSSYSFQKSNTLQGCIIVRQVFGYVEKVLELCGVEVTET